MRPNLYRFLPSILALRDRFAIGGYPAIYTPITVGGVLYSGNEDRAVSVQYRTLGYDLTPGVYYIRYRYQINGLWTSWIEDTVFVEPAQEVPEIRIPIVPDSTTPPDSAIFYTIQVYRDTEHTDLVFLSDSSIPNQFNGWKLVSLGLVERFVDALSASVEEDRQNIQTLLDLASVDDAPLETLRYLSMTLGTIVDGSSEKLVRWMVANIVSSYKIKGTFHSWWHRWERLNVEPYDVVELWKGSLNEVEHYASVSDLSHPLHSARIDIYLQCSYGCEGYCEAGTELPTGPKLGYSEAVEVVTQIQDLLPVHVWPRPNATERDFVDLGSKAIDELQVRIPQSLTDEARRAEDLFELVQSCQELCQLGCMSICETTCECNFCQNICQTGCETGCEFFCEDGCQLNCENFCETGCETDCEWACEGSCQAGCTSGCQYNDSCSLQCEQGCQAESCQATCEGCLEMEDFPAHVTCAGPCETAAQASCSAVSCETAGCQTTCVTAPQTDIWIKVWFPYPEIEFPPAAGTGDPFEITYGINPGKIMMLDIAGTGGTGTLIPHLAACQWITVRCSLGEEQTTVLAAGDGSKVTWNGSAGGLLHPCSFWAESEFSGAATTMAAASAGDTQITVADSSSMKVGRPVVIDVGAAVAEQVTPTAILGGLITLRCPLRNNHGGGAPVNIITQYMKIYTPRMGTPAGANWVADLAGDIGPGTNTCNYRGGAYDFTFKEAPLAGAVVRIHYILEDDCEYWLKETEQGIEGGTGAAAVPWGQGWLTLDTNDNLAHALPRAVTHTQFTLQIDARGHVVACTDNCETTCQGSCELGGCENCCEDCCEASTCQDSCTAGCQGTCAASCQASCTGVACEGHCQANACEAGYCESGGAEGGGGCGNACEFGGCAAACQVACDGTCQVGACQVNSCQGYCQLGTCQISCTGGCQAGVCEATSCQDSCTAGCQGACAASHQACSDQCETQCEHPCETACQAHSCQANSCQDGCTGACQWACEAACQFACEGACQWACEASCEFPCENACQFEACALACQGGNF